MKRLKKLLPTIIFGLIFLVGLGVMLYPTISDMWNRRVQSRAVASYNASVANLSEEDYSEYLTQAQAYNEALRKVGSAAALANPDLIPGYEETLSFDRTGVIGTITIDNIDVNLPIYHGTSDSVLTVGAGHLEGTSLPIGGVGNHTVISAHRGLPRAKLFTNLDRMEIGDTFVLHVMNESLWYEVDQINTVLPSEMEDIYLREGEDLCTLMTCTPYGINTHRLLVRGHRIFPSPEEEAQHAEEAAASADHSILIRVVVIAVGAVVLVLLLSQMMVMFARRKKK